MHTHITVIYLILLSFLIKIKNLDNLDSLTNTNIFKVRSDKPIADCNTILANGTYSVTGDTLNCPYTEGGQGGTLENISHFPNPNFDTPRIQRVCNLVSNEHWFRSHNSIKWLPWKKII